MRPSRSRASGVRICRRIVCRWAWTCSRYCCSAAAWPWICWSSASCFRRIASSSSSSIAMPSGASRVLGEFRIRLREFQEDLVGEGIEELATLCADRPALLLRLRQETERLELLHRLARDGTGALPRMVGSGPVIPTAAELRGEARRADRTVQVDLSQDGGDATVPPVRLHRSLLRVHPGPSERRPLGRLDLALFLQAVLESLDQEGRRHIVCGRHR